MDSVTHLLVGHAMGVAVSSLFPTWGNALYWAALLGNSLPDVDVPISVVCGQGIRWHRTITHTIPGAFVLALMGAGLVHVVAPGAPFWLTLVCTVLACLVHIGMDCLNVFGARALWPLCSDMIEVGAVHIVDVGILVLLGIPTVGDLLHVTPAALLGGAFWCLWPYLAYRIWRHRRLTTALTARLGIEKLVVFAGFLGWRYLADRSTHIESGKWHAGQPTRLASFYKATHEAVSLTETTPDVERFLEHARYPFATVEETVDGLVVTWEDALRRIRSDYTPLRIRMAPLVQKRPRSEQAS